MKKYIVDDYNQKNSNERAAKEEKKQLRKGEGKSRINALMQTFFFLFLWKGWKKETLKKNGDQMIAQNKSKTDDLKSKKNIYICKVYYK